MGTSRARRLRRSQASTPKGERPRLTPVDTLKSVVAPRAERAEKPSESPQTTLTSGVVGSRSQLSAEGSLHNHAYRTPEKASKTARLAKTADADVADSLPGDDDTPGLLPLLLGAIGTIIMSHPLPLVIGAVLTAVGTSDGN